MEVLRQDLAKKLTAGVNLPVEKDRKRIRTVKGQTLHVQVALDPEEGNKVHVLALPEAEARKVTDAALLREYAPPLDGASIYNEEFSFDSGEVIVLLYARADGATADVSIWPSYTYRKQSIFEVLRDAVREMCKRAGYLS